MTLLVFPGDKKLKCVVKTPAPLPHSGFSTVYPRSPVILDISSGFQEVEKGIWLYVNSNMLYQTKMLATHLGSWPFEPLLGLEVVLASPGPSVRTHTHTQMSATTL